MRKHNDSELNGLVGVRKDPKGSDQYEADLSIAGLGRVSLGLYPTASEAGIAHDNAKVLAAYHGLTAKPALRQRYNHPERAHRLIESGTMPAMPEALAKLKNRSSAALVGAIGVPTPKLGRVAKAVHELEGRLAAAEAKLDALLARA